MPPLWPDHENFLQATPRYRLALCALAMPSSLCQILNTPLVAKLLPEFWEMNHLQNKKQRDMEV